MTTIPPASRGSVRAENQFIHSSVLAVPSRMLKAWVEKTDIPSAVSASALGRMNSDTFPLCTFSYWFVTASQSGGNRQGEPCTTLAVACSDSCYPELG